MLNESQPQPSESEIPYTKDFKSMLNIILFNCLGFFFLDFSIPFIARNELNASGLEMGLLYSIITIGGLLSSPIAGWLTDRTSRSKLIFLGAFGRGISYFILYIAILLKSYPGIAFGYFMLGFGVGFFWVPLDTLISEKTDKDHRSFAFGKAEAAKGKGILFGTVGGVTLFLLGNAYMPAAIWFIYLAIPVFGIANFLAGVLFLWRVDEQIKYYPAGQPSPDGNNNRTAAESKRSAQLLFWGVLILLVAICLSHVNGSMSKPFVQYYLLSTLTTDPNLVILVYMPSGIIAMFLGPYLGRVVDRVKPNLSISVASIIGAFATFVLINTSAIWGFMLILIVDSTINVTSGLVMQNFVSRVTRTHRGRLFGARSLFVQLGGIIGPVLGGILWDTMGIQWPFIVSIYVELALIPLFLIAMKKILPHLVEK